MRSHGLFRLALACVLFPATSAPAAQFTLSVSDGGPGIGSNIFQPSTIREDNSYASSDGNGLGFVHVVSNTLDDPFRDPPSPGIPTIGGASGGIFAEFFVSHPGNAPVDLIITAPYYLQTSSHANASVSLQILDRTQRQVFRESIFIGASTGLGDPHSETKTGVITANLPGILTGSIPTRMLFRLTVSGATYEGGGRSQAWADPTFASSTPGGAVSIDTGLAQVNPDFIPLPEPGSLALALSAALVLGLRRRRGA